MSSNYKGKNFDPNYHLRNRGNSNHNSQGAKRKLSSRGPAPGQGRGRGKTINPDRNSKRNQPNNYYDDNGSNQRVVLSPSSSFEEQSEIAESDSESEASVQSSEHGNMGNYRGPPEKYDPNYHKIKWKRARCNSGDPREGGGGGNPSLNGMGANPNYSTYQNRTHHSTNSAPVSPAVPTFTAVPLIPPEMRVEAHLAKIFDLVIPPIPRSESQPYGVQNADAATNELIKADIKEQLVLEIQQLEKELALAVKENRDGDAQRADFEIKWRVAEKGYYQKAFCRADMIDHPVEKFNYLLKLQIDQSEARRRMEAHIKNATPSVLRTLMDACLMAAEEATRNNGPANTSTSTLPQRAFVPTQVTQKILNMFEKHDKQFAALLDPGTKSQLTPHVSPLPASASNPVQLPSHPQSGPVGGDLQVKVEPSEPTASIGATVSVSSTPSPFLKSTKNFIFSSAQASTVPTVPITTTFKTSPSPAFIPVSSFSTGITAAPAIHFSTFAPTVPTSPFTFSSTSNSYPFAFGQTNSPGVATSASIPPSYVTHPPAPKGSPASVKESTSSTTVAVTSTVATRSTASPLVVPSLPQLHNSTSAVGPPRHSSKSESEPTQSTTKPSSVLTVSAPASGSAPALGAALPSASLPAPASVPTPAPVTPSSHNNIASETRSVPVSSSSPVTDGHNRRSSVVDNLASLVLASASSLIPADLDKQITKLQEDNKEQAVKYEKLQRMVESESRRREAIEKQVSEYQVDLQSSRITALEKDLECRRAEAVEMMAKAREERLQAREETAKARQGQAEAREEVAKARLGQVEATLRASTAEAENQRLRDWFKENESRLGGLPLPPLSGTTPSLTVTLECPSANSSPLSASSSRFPQPPLNKQTLATVDRLTTSFTQPGPNDMDLGSEAVGPVETKPPSNLAALV
ncbi:hypothetical protein BGZ93_002963 [Podila epicladia]|nr:hypothetical protein BGZ93_002963 [Podila epicladia]